MVIPHLNTPDLLARCLESVVGQTLDHGFAEILVADNGSTVMLDDVKAAYPTVAFVVEPEPGPGLARNRGIAAATAPVLAFIDADCRAETGWLQTAVDAVEADPERAVIGGDVRIDFVDPSALTPIEAYEAVFGFQQKTYIEKMKFSGAGNLAMSARVFARVGPFCGIGQAEDAEWGNRAHAAGFPARYIPEMRIYHPARPDFDALKRKWQRHIVHTYHQHRAEGRSRSSWLLRALAMFPSIPVHSLRLLTSERLSGVANRFRGIGVLTRIRIFRAFEMIRLSNSPDESIVHLWNRQS